MDIEQIADLTQKRAIEIQISEFGQTPKQLFKIPHPPRSSSVLITELRAIWRVEQILSKREATVTEVPLHRKRISSLHLSEDKAVSTGFDGCVKVVPLDKYQRRSFNVSDLALSCSALMSPKQIACGSYDHKIYLFSLSNGRTQDSIRAHEDAITCCEYLPELVLPT